ncbi:MAG TPA: ABC transporter ATP-binding protein [Actinomycetota bacterium]|nr:ABC transporter ATP-binding protein [Actinomycetota bacterium]
MTGDAGSALLSVQGLRIWAEAEGRRRTIVAGLDLEVGAGETVGLVGESGSGKSLTARAIVRLLPEGVRSEGRVVFDGTDLSALPEGEMRSLRGRRLSLMFQDPFTMLNPLLRCGEHVAEMLAENGARVGREGIRAETARRLREVGLDPEAVAHRYPFQLSGGMRQRVALAAALARDPDLLIADEPSTALDVTTQAEILDLLRRIQRARRMGLVLITHDLRVAFSICDRISVLYAGNLLEVGASRDLEATPLHPYTLGLLLSEPPVDRKLRELVPIPGSVPAPDEVADRCAFAPRCRWAAPACLEGRPPLVEVAPGRWSACVRVGEIATKMAALRERSLAPAIPSPAPHRPLLAVEGLRKTFLPGRGRRVEALRGVSLVVEEGESVGLVGESGSGKTTLGRCLVGLEEPDAGRIEIGGLDASRIGRLSRSERTTLRRTVQMIFQDPYSTLNPRHSVGWTLGEALRTVEPALRGAALRRAVAELLDRVGLPAAYAARRPAALSGGERQRVAIARALAVRPRLLVCDEPVSALDVSVQAQILNLFRRLQEETGIAYLFITHDLAVVRQVADRLYVLYRGEVVEEGPADVVLSRPQHPYTRRLIASVPGPGAAAAVAGSGAEAEA